MRDNVVYGTGGRPGSNSSRGISAHGADVVGNLVSGVWSHYGVGVQGDSDSSTLCSGNTVGGFAYNQYLTCRDGGGNLTF